MLTVDPRHRIAVADIQRHPWFQQDLPAGTLEVNAQLQQTDSARCRRCPLSHAQTSMAALGLICGSLYLEVADFSALAWTASAVPDVALPWTFTLCFRCS